MMLFFDFDGTLAPIASKPGYARIPDVTLSLLKEVLRLRSCKLAVVSGRALADIKKKIGLKGIVYVGNHGLQIRGAGVRYTAPLVPGYKASLRKIKARIARGIRRYSGALIEDKGLSLSVHYRLVSARDCAALRMAVRKIAQPYCARRLIRVRTGKMVMEIRPDFRWDKGSAVRWLIGKWRALDKGARTVALCCGDDSTDEDAFRALAGKGITVVVGRRAESAAQYFLDTQDEVNGLLRRIITGARQTLWIPFNRQRNRSGSTRV